MYRALGSALLGVSFLLAGSVSAQTYTIKLKNTPEGTSTVVSKDEQTVFKLKVIDGQGNVVADKNNKEASASSFTETVVKRKDKELPTLMERDYAKLEGKAADLLLVGKTVVIERKGNKHTFALKGGEPLSDKAAAMLTKEFLSRNSENYVDMNQLMVPKVPVKVGETWKPDAAVIARQMTEGGILDIDASKLTVVGKLLKVYTKDGRQYGELQYKSEFPVKALGKGKEQLQFPKGGKATMDMTLNACIDGSSESGVMTTRMALTGEASLPSLPGGSIALNIVTTGSEARRELDKK